MSPKTLIPVVEQVLLGCGVPYTLIAQADRVVFVMQKVASTLQIVWAQLSYALCESNLVSGVFNIPLQWVGNSSAVIWADDLPFIFCQDEHEQSIAIPCRPTMVHAITVAIGGCSGSGKTSISRMVQGMMPGEIITYPAHTNRPRRPAETDGQDYHFHTDEELLAARHDSRFRQFVEARGYWYWNEPEALLTSVWQFPQKIHLFFISQLHDFENRRRLFPEMHWIWLEVTEEELYRRLTAAGDRDLQSSTDYNRRLLSQDRTKLLDITFKNDSNPCEQTVEAIADYFRRLQSERKRRCKQS